MKGNFHVRFGERGGETHWSQGQKVRSAPTLRSGSLAIKCVQEVANADPERADDYSVYGQESNGSTWALAKMNMFLHDVSGARIDWGDTLKAPTLLEGEGILVRKLEPFGIELGLRISVGRPKDNQHLVKILKLIKKIL